MGKPQFENNWREVFEGAESAVPDAVWDKVEMDLVRMENKTNKTRVIYYQRLAASVALFALMMAAYIAYDRSKVADEELQMAEQSIANKEGGFKKESEFLKENLIASSSEGSNEIGDEEAVVPSARVSQGTKTPSITSGSIVGEVSQANDRLVQNKQEDLVAFVPDFPYTEIKIKRKTFYEPNFPRKLPAMPSYLMASNKKEENKMVYASLGFAGGSYSPGSVSSAPSSLSRMAVQSSFIMDQVEPQSAQASMGTAYSIGVNAGKQLSRRWAIQSGLGYVVQNIDYTSNYTSISPDNSLRATVADYAYTETMIAIAPPYSIRSVNKYLSIPIQVGYKLVDRKIGLQLNGGLSTDLFINNTLRDDSGLTESYTQSAGKDSPYRSVNWSGMMGLELSHQLADRYQVALVPGVRYSLNSALKNNAEVSYNPLVLDIGLRVKYLFR